MLAETDPDRAARVLEQVRVLHPDLGPEPWRSRLQALDVDIAIRLDGDASDAEAEADAEVEDEDTEGEATP